MLVRQLRKTERIVLRDLYCYSSSPAVKDETRDVAGRLHTWAAGLGVLGVLRHGIPRHLQIGLSAKICGMLAMC